MKKKQNRLRYEWVTSLDKQNGRPLETVCRFKKLFLEDEKVQQKLIHREIVWTESFFKLIGWLELKFT